MAVIQDYDSCQQYFRKWSINFSPQRIIGCSLDSRQWNILSRLYPQASRIAFSISDWDLNNPCPTSADLIVFCNVFHYATAPERWFRHALAACRQLWVQDLLFRWRGSAGLGTDGDSMRYTLGHNYDPIVPTFDLTNVANKLLDFASYDAGSFAAGRLMINFVAAFEGDLREDRT